MYAQSIGCVIKVSVNFKSLSDYIKPTWVQGSWVCTFWTFQWFIGKNMGLMSSIVVAGYGFGGAIWIPLETVFVNPNNTAAVAEDPTDDTSDMYWLKDNKNYSIVK